MSSNLEIPKTCLHCGSKFVAKKTSTKFCSISCAQRNYKVRERIKKVDSAKHAVKEQLSTKEATLKIEASDPDLIDIEHLSFYTSISKRTIFRLLKDPLFPKIKVGRRLLFNKKRVIGYLEQRYSS